jgi:hypothetical protein
MQMEALNAKLEGALRNKTLSLEEIHSRLNVQPEEVKFVNNILEGAEVYFADIGNPAQPYPTKFARGLYNSYKQGRKLWVNSSRGFVCCNTFEETINRG